MVETIAEDVSKLIYISTWDVAKESDLDCDSRIQDILYASQEHRLLNR